MKTQTSELLYDCATCGRTNFTAAGLRSHRCTSKLATRAAAPSSSGLLSSVSKSSVSSDSDQIAEILELADEIASHLRRSCGGALRIGLRLIALQRATGDSDSPGGFRAAIAALRTLQSHPIAESTAYRWINAAAAVLCREHGTTDISDVFMPPPGSQPWLDLEAILHRAAQGMSLRRLLVGPAATGEESRFDSLITAAEAGDAAAEEMLDRVARGEITLVQAIRAAGGASTTRDKTRNDPVYLDIDGRTGHPIGLVPKCLVTLSNAFARWDTLDETARREMRASWKALVGNLPKELR